MYLCNLNGFVVLLNFVFVFGFFYMVYFMYNNINVMILIMVVVLVFSLVLENIVYENKSMCGNVLKEFFGFCYFIEEKN